MNKPDPSSPTTTSQIHRLHVVFKTHLDVGFTDLARNVVALYMNDFLPRALALAAETRRRGQPERFIWTVGSWLVWEFLEQRNSEQRRYMEQAIEQGDIVWHALPFTMHSELMDASLFRHGLSLSQRLDRRFGKCTVAAKCTDVPGHTLGVVSLLAEAGVKLLHIGVNPASALPRLPPVFRWRSPGGAEVIVIYSGDYGETTTIPILNEGLSICFTGDNLGPQSPTEVDAVFAQLRVQHPEVEAVGSTLNAFAEKLDNVRASLPVIEAEIGDTWIHGAGTDPAKVAAFRELMRLRRRWIEKKGESPFESGIDRFSQKLLQVAEHTWGLDIKKCLGTEPGESRTYDRDFEPELFRSKRHLPEYQRFEASWAEQRQYLDDAVNSLGNSKRTAQARAALYSQSVNIHESTVSADWQALRPGQLLSNANYEIGIDESTGAINHLVDGKTGTKLANPGNLLARFRYDLYSSADYRVLWKKYIRNKRAVRWWAEQDFTKPGLDRVIIQSRHWHPAVEDISWRADDKNVTCRVLMSSPPDAVYFGCPRKLVLRITISDHSPTVEIDFSWFEKQANRVPEAMWLAFTPPNIDPSSVRFRKLGQWIDPRQVIANGGRHLHAIDDRIRLGQKRGGCLEIESLDSPLVTPGPPTLVRFSNRTPMLKEGVSFNLHNNVWGTNFPMWYEQTGHSRFRVSLRE